MSCTPFARVAFASDACTAAYYEQRADEYDEWYEGRGLFATRDRPGWHDEVEQVAALLSSLPPLTTLDVACGTAFLSRHLGGEVVGVDQSASMIGIARDRLGRGRAVVGDALTAPFRSGRFQRVFTGHFYGHLPPGERAAFLTEARRLGGELVVVDSALRPGVAAEEWQERTLNDGSRHRVYKRYLTAAELASEIDGHALHQGRWFVAARVRWAESTEARP